MIGSIIGVYKWQDLSKFEIKPGMIGRYLEGFYISYKPVNHGRPLYNFGVFVDELAQEEGDSQMNL